MTGQTREALAEAVREAVRVHTCAILEDAGVNRCCETWDAFDQALLALASAPALQAQREPQWISVADELPPAMKTVPMLTPEKRSATGWAHSYGSWNDDPDDDSRPDSIMFKNRNRNSYWLKLPTLPANPFKKV